MTHRYDRDGKEISESAIEAKLRQDEEAYANDLANRPKPEPQAQARLEAANRVQQRTAEQVAQIDADLAAKKEEYRSQEIKNEKIRLEMEEKFGTKPSPTPTPRVPTVRGKRASAGSRKGARASDAVHEGVHHEHSGQSGSSKEG